MSVARIIASVAVAALASACVASPQATVRAPAPTAARPLSPEDQKKDIAIARDRGLIGFEEAARRQYAIQRENYSMTRGDVRFWEASIAEARKVDQGLLTPDDYKRRVQVLYSQNART
ncbi:hypothetical protein [Chthonobacter rhizosphaerae]|uniref:hypothetical protein n=1 Tax=Chthonobacter rhizosphaerae TaxID=2735553 RepID=UPI0015EE8A40|nr:hypothetical protein [Chthonobacter rhizosphaerae]